MTSLVFRGTGDSQGVPRVYCDCEVCGEARLADGGTNRRSSPSVQLEDPAAGTIWIDCGPDWPAQMEVAGLRGVDHMLITHPHYDHIGGLPAWYDACRWTKERGVAYAPAEVIEETLLRFPWLASCIDFRPIEGAIELGEWRIAAWRVNHGRNGYAYAFRFEHRKTDYAWVYCPDSIDLTEEQQQPLHDLDLLVLGTSFFEEPYPKETRSVYDVQEAIELVGRWKPRRTWLTHMSHAIDIRKGEALPGGMAYAVQGQRVMLAKGAEG